MVKVMLVALGGAVGAAARYAAGMIPGRVAFPLNTLLINLAGALIIGFIAGLGGRVSEKWSLFLKMGVCGGFTTFSTFSLESCSLIESGKYLTAALYILLSVSLCIAGAAAGGCIGRRLYA